jgi:hypothetical protein
MDYEDFDEWKSPGSYAVAFFDISGNEPSGSFARRLARL